MSITPNTSTSAQRKHRRWMAWALAVVALLAVFALYSQPEFMVMLAAQVWACF